MFVIGSSRKREAADVDSEEEDEERLWGRSIGNRRTDVDGGVLESRRRNCLLSPRSEWRIVKLLRR